MNNYPQSTKKSTLISGIVSLLLILFAGTFLLPKLQDIGIPYETVLYISRFFIWFCLAILFLFSFYIEKQPFLLYKEQAYPLSYYFKSVVKTMLILIAALFFVSLLIKAIGYPVESEKMNQIMKIFKNNIPLIAFTCVTAGITEELLFRGYLTPRLEILLKNKYGAIILSSILFGLLHYSYGTLIQVIGPFTIGLVFALHYNKYQNIKIVIICHFLWDFMVLLIKNGQLH